MNAADTNTTEASSYTCFTATGQSEYLDLVDCSTAIPNGIFVANKTVTVNRKVKRGIMLSAVV